MTRTAAPSATCIVVGGGVIGCAVARELALAGVGVTLLDAGPPEARASWAAAGMLSPLAEADRADAFLPLLLASRALYPELVAALGEEVGYRDEGTLVVAMTQGDEAGLRARYDWQVAAGAPVAWLSPAELREREPQLAQGARAGLFYPGDHQVDSRLLASALWRAAERAGARMRAWTPVTRVGRNEVELPGGETLRARWIVVAGGAWSGSLAGLPRPLPVRPVHGQLLALRPRRPLAGFVVDTPRIYLVPRGDGRVIVGATAEQTGFERQVTAGGSFRLLGAALEAIPSLADAEVVESWSGLRPGTPDGWPILGPDPEVPGLLYATGHYRNGILLAPITARLVADLVLGRTPVVEPAPFSIGRFAIPLVTQA